MSSDKIENPDSKESESDDSSPASSPDLSLGSPAKSSSDSSASSSSSSSSGDESPLDGDAKSPQKEPQRSVEPAKATSADSISEGLFRAPVRTGADGRTKKAPKGYFTKRVFTNASLKLERDKGIKMKKTQALGHVFAAQATVYYESLLTTALSPKSEERFRQLSKQRTERDRVRTAPPETKLLLVSGEPKLFWNRAQLESALQSGTCNGRTIVTSDLSSAIRKDPLVSPYFSDVEIPVGRSVATNGDFTRKELKEANRAEREKKRKEKKEKKEKKREEREAKKKAAAAGKKKRKAPANGEKENPGANKRRKLAA
jgi:hypothetical protein